MGGTLPILSQAFVRREDAIGRAVGTLYAVNTFGAVAGVIVAGYSLLPALGNRTTPALAAWRTWRWAPRPSATAGDSQRPNA